MFSFSAQKTGSFHIFTRVLYGIDFMLLMQKKGAKTLIALVANEIPRVKQKQHALRDCTVL